MVVKPDWLFLKKIKIVGSTSDRPGLVWVPFFCGTKLCEGNKGQEYLHPKFV